MSKRAWVFVGWVFTLNLLWEVAQLPLYAIAQDPRLGRIAYAVLHCAVGDVLITLFAWLITGLILRDMQWVSSQPWIGGAIATALGIAYTIHSEWTNVYVTGGWGYSPRMPLVRGIGIAPLMQWIVLPVVALVTLRGRFAKHTVGG